VTGLDFAVLGPAGRPDASLPIAGSRAGAIGLVDLEFAGSPNEAGDALARLAALGRGRRGALVDGATDLLDVVLGGPALDVVLLSNGDGERLGEQIHAIHRRGAKAYVVATGVDAARIGEAAGADGLIAKGHEAGGWVGDDGSFVLLQQCIAELGLPVWAYGGIGLHTAAACRQAGAAGAVLDAQLLLARETPLGAAARSRLRGMDGSETACVGAAAGASLRVYSRPGIPALEALRELELDGPLGDAERWRAAVRPRVDWAEEGAALAVGQDAAFAADLAERFVTVGGILAALRDAVSDQCRAARRANPLDEGAPLAVSHGTRYPVVQGPMTRVSDRAEFALAVAEAGALPLLALALMRGNESAALLEQTKALLRDRPWGVGILGFVPAALRAEQLEAIRATRPPFALIAGGRPDQARQLEDDGIATYLHVPSPALLRLYLKDGARRFVFEGRECGGHVGPRTSFVLWDTMIRTLLEELPAGASASDHHLLFAGGIHDARSAAMVAAAAAPLVARGARVGVLLGTAYLFTQEAVEHGAITERFQQAALAAGTTVLLESGPGHATRCLPSPFAGEFETERRRLRREGISGEEQRLRLEGLNIGRLRIAAKGRDRNPARADDAEAPALTSVPAAEQWERGLYMIGQVAGLRDRIGTLAELHGDICAGSAARLEALPEPAVSPEPALPPADIAIVGIGSIVPGASELATFWSNILNKVDAITEVPASRWDWRRYYDADRAAPDRIYSRWGGFVGDVPFDPIEFGMPPNSLRSIEPFQLLGLLAAHAALRDAGYADRPFPRERASVILGAGGGGADLSVGYTVRSSLPALFGDASSRLSDALGDRLPQWTEDSFPGLLMNVAAGRIANRLDLGGTNFTVDAACASALASISLAVRELQTGTSDLAIAGGVDAIQNPFAYLCFSKTQALSPGGRCRPFDASADGIAISEGFATVVLKRVADAERDGDRIYAVIRGVGSASDGRDRSLTAPRPEGQMRALRRAYGHAGFSPATVGLVEAHGTGTVAGDRAEVEALSRVYSEAGAGVQGCAIGSIKSMIGHTKATAGVAGLIKAALALHHKVLPPTIGVTAPNPKADFPASPFYVNTETRPWMHAAQDHPRRAAVSAFGFGGTNFHIVLEEYTGAFLPEPEAPVDPWPAELFLFRAPSRSDLLAAVTAVGDLLASGAEPALGDLAATLAGQAEGREGGPALAVVADSLGDLAAKLASARELLEGDADRMHAPGGIHYAQQPLTESGGVAVLFPGQGSQSVDMGREVAVAFPAMREAFEQADRVLADRLPQPLSRYVFPPPAFTPEERQQRLAELTETDVAQPALGAVDLGYLRLLRSFGVEPDMVAGHSYGEFVALAAAGAFSDDALFDISEARGRFIREGATEESGAMAAVQAARDALAPLLAGEDVVVANLNSPEQTVLSGSEAAIGRAIAWCGDHGLRARRLPVACAFHSPLVRPARQRLSEQLGRTAMAPPRLPVYSNTTAAPYPEDPAAVAELLGEHLVRPVDFVGEIEAMYEDGGRVFVEAGPRGVLTGLVDGILGERQHVAVPIDLPGRNGIVQLLHCLAALVVEGVSVDPVRLFAGRSVRPLDPATLEPAAGRPRRSAATWLVNGGRARPAAQSLTPTPPVPLETLTMSNGDAARSNGHADVQITQPPVGPSPPGDALPVPSAAAPAGDVMAHYQLVMQRFLDTERTVMLAYLGAPRQSSRAAPAAPATVAAIAPPAVTNGRPAPAPAEEVRAEDPPPAAPAAPVAPAADVAVPDTVVGVGDVRTKLLQVVSERTGYPPEMLDLDADMEADLGIDSIKRVEIAGTMIQEMPPGGAEADVEQITASRTLREVIDALEAVSRAGGAHAEPSLPFEREPSGGRIGRFVVAIAGAPAITERAGLAPTGVVVIVDDATGVGAELAARLDRRDEPILMLSSSDCDGPEAGTRLRESVAAGGHGRIKALVHLGALGPEAGEQATSLFLLAQAAAADLEAAAADGGAAVVGATRMGGTFAVEGGAPGVDPAHGAVPGLLKTLALEWPAVRVKAVDLPNADPAAAAAWLEDELFAADGLVEVGYRDGRRTVPELVPAPTGDRDGTPPVDADSVVLVTGGARGITAEVAVALAERHQPTLVVVGRTDPADEDPATAGLRDERELKRAIFERRQAAGADVTVATVEREYRKVVRGREVRENLARMRRAGARVEYRPCDVRDGVALAALVASVYDQHGRIDGVIHGAGVIEDKLLRDKGLTSFERVLATKAGSARRLAAALRPDTLRFVVFFSSVSGRFGNRGQADYAAASDILNKLAQDLDRRWDARVVAIDWGPWLTAGMVTPEVRRQFAERGVELIPVDVGTRLFEEELRLGRKGEAEVVIGGVREPAAPVNPLLATADTVTPRADGGAEVTRTLDPARDLYLADHRLDGTPVFPFAAAMELMAATAATARPGLQITGLRRVRLLRGITVDRPSLQVRVTAVPDGATGMDVLIQGVGDDPPRHFSAAVELGEALPTAEPGPESLGDLPPFPVGVDEAYAAYLFHGPLFRGIAAIEGMDERGARATLRPSEPADCLRGLGIPAGSPAHSGWLLDPILLDCAFQLQVLWARLHWDVTPLPAQLDRYERFAAPPSSARLIRHELRMHPANRSPICVADHWFRGADGTLLATLTAVQAVGTRALNRLAGVSA
jgi:acyl transferase domain-containing protein/NAD(P)H-dependent flavin oxidoreductase YrpB (nitropropane dioxygenase family)/NAD(P)-dependent dehydrogenase (short-subunit alcohol dehydrogenase family)